MLRPATSRGHGARLSEFTRRKTEALLSDAEHDGVRLVGVERADGMLLHGDAVSDRREQSRFGRRVDRACRLVRPLVEHASDERGEKPLALVMVALECGGKGRGAGCFAPRVDPHAIVLLGGGCEPGGKRWHRVEPAHESVVALELCGHCVFESGCDELVSPGEVVANESVHDADLGSNIAKRDPCEAFARNEPEGGAHDLVASLVRTLACCSLAPGGCLFGHESSVGRSRTVLSMRTSTATVIVQMDNARSSGDGRRGVVVVDRLRRGLVPAVVTAMVLLAAASFVIFPLLPSLQLSLDVTTAEIGYLAAAGFAAALIAELLVAPLADRGHARSMAITGVLFVSTSLVLSGFADAGWQLIAGRALGGFGFGVFVIAASALLVRSDPPRSGELLGRMGAAELAGIALGPLVAGAAVSVVSPSLILGVSGVVVLIALVPVWLGFRERAVSIHSSSSFDGDDAHPQTGGIAAGVIGFDGTDADRSLRFGATPAPRTSLDLVRNPRIVGIVLLYAAVMVPTGAYDGIWPRYMTDIGAEPLLVAASYVFFSIPYVIVAGWAGRLADRRGGVSAYWRGLAVLLPIVALYGVVGNPWLVTGMGFVESTGQALAFIGAAAAMAHSVDPARAGSAQGLLRGLGLVAATVAAGVSGLAYEAGGALLLFGGTGVTVLAIAAVGLLLARKRRA